MEDASKTKNVLDVPYHQNMLYLGGNKSEKRELSLTNRVSTSSEYVIMKGVASPIVANNLGSHATMWSHMS